MDNLSSLTIALSIVGFIALIAILVSLFYKPGKKLDVITTLQPEEDGSTPHNMNVEVTNTGKNRVKMQSPFVKFSHGTGSMIYKVNPHKIHCRFPRILNVGEKVNCTVDLTQYHESLDNSSFHPTHVKIVIKDTMGMKFDSHSIHYKR
ncbi:MAG: hypothetical protein R2750_01770 [Bacteroidales bacterium]